MTNVAEIRVGGVVLDNLMRWVDETKNVLRRATADRTLEGNLAVQVFDVVGGVPITLVGDNLTGWQKKSTVLALKSLAETGPFSFDLEFYDSNATLLQSYTCRFRHEESPAVDFDPVGFLNALNDGNAWEAGTIKLITI